MRVSILEFLDAEIFSVSNENCVSFMDPLVESWDIDLATFSMEIVLNRRLIPGYAKTFEFVERERAGAEEEPGLADFLRQSVNGGATEEEIQFLRRLRFKGKHPTPLYYYRELQNLRDPLHFRERPDTSPRKRLLSDKVQKEMQLDSRKVAIQRWAKNKTAANKKSSS
jgi:hypothetical protein